MSDFANWMQDQQAQEKNAAMVNLTAQQRGSPAQIQRAKTLSTDLNIPSPLIEADPAPYEAQAKAQKMGSLLDENPWMAGYYAQHPDAAALTGPEDPAKIATIGQSLGFTQPNNPQLKLGGPINPLAPPTLQHTAPDLPGGQDPYGGSQYGDRSFAGASFYSGAHALLATGFQLASDLLGAMHGGDAIQKGVAAAVDTGSRLTQEAMGDKPDPDVLSSLAQQQQSAAGDVMGQVSSEQQALHGGKQFATLDPDKAAYRDPMTMFGNFLQMAPMVVGLAATAAFTHRASPMQIASVLAAGEGALFGTQQQVETQNTLENQDQSKWDASPQYQAMIKSGVTPEVAKVYLATTGGRLAGIGAGLASAAISGIGGPVLAKILGEGSGALGRFGRGAVQEGLTGLGFNTSMTLAGNVGTAIATNPNQDLSAGLGEAAVSGLLLGSFTGGTTRALFHAPAEAARSIEGAVHDQTVLDHIMTASQNVEMRKHSPEEFGKMVDHAAEGGSATHVYLPIEAVDKVLADPTVPEEEKAALRVHQSQIDDARLTQGDVVMPVGEVASKLAGTKTWDMLKDDVRLQQGGISGSEAKVHMQSMIAELEKAGGDAYDQAHAAAPQLEAKQDVYTQAKAQALAAGMSAKEAQTTAVLWANHADAVAHSLTQGKFADAREAWNWMQLEMKRGKADAAPPPTAAAGPLTVKNIKMKINPLEGTRHELTLSDGSKVHLYRDTDQFGASNPQWYVDDPLGQEDHSAGSGTGSLGSTKAEALERVTSAVERGRERAALLRQEPLTVQQSHNDQRISTRLPSTKGAKEDPIGNTLDVGLDAMERNPTALEHNLGLVGNYDGVKLEGKTLAERAASFIQHAKDNLLWLHDRMPADVRGRAKLWYDGANHLSEAWSKDFGVPPSTIAGVLAAMSPQKDWYQNASLAERVLDVTLGKPDAPYTPEMGETAQRIFADPKFAESLAALEGKKLSDLKTTYLKAMFVRLYDQTYHPPGYRILSPEGNFEGNATGKVGWGSMVEIGKAIEVIENGSRENVSARMGGKHKVRSFYNNIIAPAAGHDVTIDTHAVAAALLRPLSGSDAEVMHNFGSSPAKDKIPGFVAAKAAAEFGIEGTYGLYAEAYRQAAEERGLLPREMQSITWEAVRGLFPAKFKSNKGNVANINELWQRYSKGEATLEETRDAVEKAAGGITLPDWTRSSGAAAPAAEASSYEGELSALRVSRRGAEGNASGLSAQPHIAEDGHGYPLEDVLSSEGSGTRDPTILQQFGGIVGAERLGRDGGLHAAQDMEEAGIHKDDIWRDTGWNRGDDGKWRFEIDDSKLRVKEMPLSEDHLAEDYVNFGGRPTVTDGSGDFVFEGEKLSSVIDHPELFKAYPELAHMPLFNVPMGDAIAGYFDGIKIVLNSDYIDHRHANLEGQQQSTLLHEIQHAVQMIEGFSNGASTAAEILIKLGFEQELKDTEQRFRDINNGKVAGWSFPRLLSDSEVRQAAADDLYTRAAGEVEARNTESRASLSEGMRRAIKPDALADVPPDRRLVMPQMDRTSFSEVGGDKPTENAPRGETAFFPNGKTVISLFKSDYSTMLHEMSHVFLDHMIRLADMPEASPQLKADMATLGKWFEKNGTPLNPDGSLSVPAHELFARTGERYFREGKAPSPELRDTFKQLATWLGSVYKSVKDLLAHGAAPINNEIREIMDRQLATQDAIEQNATQPMSQVELGMTDAEYGRYLASVKGARDKGYDTLLEKMMQAIRQRDQSRLKTQRDNVRASVAKEINADPKFVALHLLRTGRWLDDPSREATPVKLNTGWLIDNYGEDVLKQLPVGLQPLHRADGLVGDHVAELTGMKSGDDLVKSLVELKQQADALKASGNPRPLRDQMIEDETNTRMAERHGDVARSDDDIRDEAIAALNSDRQGEVLAAELRQLKKQNGQKGEVTPYSMLREWARRKVNDAKVSDATSKAALQGYTRNYNKARSLFEKALLDKDPAEALKQKQAQMINHALLAEGKKVADEIGSVVNRLKRYADTAAMSSIDQDYMDRIHELVEGYNFRNVSDKTRAAKVSFEDWAAAQRAKGEEVLVPARFRDDRMNWKDAKVAKLLELNDMVQSLVHLGKLKQTLFDKQQAKALAEVRDDAESRILNLPDRKRPDVSVGEDSRGFIKRMSDAKTFGEYRDAVVNTLFKPAGLRRMISGLVKTEKMFDILDGEGDGTGPLNKQMVWGASDAASKFGDVWEEVMQPMIDQLQGDRKMTARLNDLVTIKELTLNVSLHEADDAKLGEPITVSRKKLLGLLLHTGNLSNLTKLVGGEKWGNHESATDIERVRNILLSYTTKEDMDLAQSMWDGVGKLWPHIAEVERQMSGVVPERVVPTPFEAHGKTYEGGYWPVIFDRDRSIMGQRAGEEAEKGLFGVGAGVGTQKGHTITRTEALAPLEWSPDNILFGHMTDAISRIAYAPWVRDSLKLVDDPRIKGAIKLKLGNEYASLIKPWMKDQIPSSYTDTKGSKAWEQAIGGIRNRMTIATLGLSYTTSLAQMLGINYVLGNLSEGTGNIGSGAKWLAKGIQEQIKQGKDGAEGPQEFVFNRSPEMARRTHEYNVEVQNAIAQLKDNDSLANRLRVKGMWHIGFVDLNMVALPAWYGAYHQGLDKGLSEEEAARYGDKIVRLSHGTGRAKDLAAISRGTAAQKFITMFYGPSSVFFNQQWAASQHIRAGNWSKALAPTFYFLGINALAAAAIHRDLPQKDENGDLSAASIGKWVARNELFGSMYGIPLVRDIADVTSRKMAGEYASYGATPISVMSDTIGKGITAARSIYNKDEMTGASLKAEAQAAGFLFGIPGNQPGKTAGFLKDVYDGKEQPHSAGDWYKGLVYGSPHHARSQV